jgi:hypothetical protein
VCLKETETLGGERHSLAAIPWQREAAALAKLVAARKREREGRMLLPPGSSFPLSSEALVFTSIRWPTRRTHDLYLARECQKALAQKTRSIGM